MQAVVRPMATRLLLSSLRRSIPPAPGSTSGAYPGGDLRHRLAGLLHSSSEVRHLHVLPRTGVSSSWFGGSHSSPRAPRNIFAALLRDVLCSSFVCSSAVLLSGDKSEVSKPNLPPTGPHDHGSNNNREKRRCTDAIIGINLLVHAADVATNRKLSLWGVRDNALIRTGQVWRLATSAVLHGGLLHITVNSFALDDLGPIVEQATGPKTFLAIYCTSALTGSVLSYFTGPQCSLGASGAICGLLGAQAVYTWRNREFLKNADSTLTDLGFAALINVGIGLYFRRYINNWSHLGGLLGGVAVEWFVGPYWNQHVSKDGMVVYEDKAPIVQLMNSKTAVPSCT